MSFIRFGPLWQAYPFVNLATGPKHQCAIRMSRCFRAAYPEFYEDLLKWGEHRRMFRTREASGELFRKAQDMADLLADVRCRTGKWIFPCVRRASTREAMQALRTEFGRGGQNGIIFFKNCFRPKGPGDVGLPAELLHHLDGSGDHIDLHVSDPQARSAPAPVRREAQVAGLRVSNHMEIWDGRADEIWFWPLGL